MYAQSKEEDKYYVVTVAFYNVENLYDTLDDPLKKDDEFLPHAEKKWNTTRYYAKLDHLSKVIEKLGDDDGPEILGLCEVENKEVLVDLAATPRLKDYEYKIVHFHSPDARGVDVALMFKAKYFKPLHTKSLRLVDSTDTSFVTRDQLLVTGVLINDTISFMVNHWPSRRGGRSDAKRILAAKLSRKHIDSILSENPEAKIIHMGDLNDDPTNRSVYDYLNAKPPSRLNDPRQLCNPSYDLNRAGYGTLAHDDVWQIFDQISFTQGLLRNKNEKFYYRDKSAAVYVQKYMLQKEGRFAGYPFRTFVGNEYTNGYSDHFPAYIQLLQKQR